MRQWCRARPSRSISWSSTWAITSTTRSSSSTIFAGCSHPSLSARTRDACTALSASRYDHDARRPGGGRNRLADGGAARHVELADLAGAGSLVDPADQVRETDVERLSDGPRAEIGCPD